MRETLFEQIAVLGKANFPIVPDENVYPNMRMKPDTEIRKPLDLPWLYNYVFNLLIPDSLAACVTN